MDYSGIACFVIDLKQKDVSKVPEHLNQIRFSTIFDDSCLYFIGNASRISNKKQCAKFNFNTLKWEKMPDLLNERVDPGLVLTKNK